MWSPRCTDRATPWSLLLGAALVTAGCASSGPKPDGAGRQDGSRPGQGEPVAVEIPAEAMTMYEQAVAVMASGDFLDAELRLKEFVLRPRPHI
jgi:TolA-binding protein